MLLILTIIRGSIELFVVGIIKDREREKEIIDAISIIAPKSRKSPPDITFILYFLHEVSLETFSFKYRLNYVVLIFIF